MVRLVSILTVELLFGFILAPLLIRIARKFGFTDKPDSNLKTHQEEIPHIGGLIVLVTAAVAFVPLQWGQVSYSFKQFVELAALMLLFEIGMIDDHQPLTVGWRLIMHSQIALALVAVGNVFHLLPWDWANYALTFIGIVTCINAINLLDIMDGLAGGISFFVIVGLCYSYLIYEIQPFYIIIGLVIMVALIPFLVSNFVKPPNKSFLGDSGSTMLGLCIAILFINSTQASSSGAGTGAALVFISIPLFEIFFVSTMRLKQKRNPFKGSPDHFPLRLLKAVSKPHIAILIIYGWCCLILAGGILILHAVTTIKIAVAIIVGLSFLGVWIRLARVPIR